MNRTITTMRHRCIVVATALVLVACGGSDRPADDSLPREAAAVTTASDSTQTATDATDIVTVSDDLGDVDVDAPARRIVTTSDETTEMIVALGLRPVGVASTRIDATAPADERFDDYFLTPARLGVPDFLGGDTLNFEAIAALDPDLIVHGGADDNLDTLTDIAPTVVFDIEVPGRWQQALTELGAATGTGNEAARLVADYDTAVADARRQVAAIAAQHPDLTVIYPNYRGGDDNFVFDADFALASIVPELGFDLVGIDAAEPAFPGVGSISTERYETLAERTDTIVALGPDDWTTTASGPFLDTLTVPVLDVRLDEGRPSTGPLSAPFYLDTIVAALDAEY